MSEDERYELQRLNGFYVGQLSAEEARLFEAGVEANVAYRSYEGALGMLGLSTVRLLTARDAQ